MQMKLNRVARGAPGTVPAPGDTAVTTERLLRGRKVLVIEDDASIRSLVLHKVASMGAEVFAAGDGESGLREFYSARPDVVLVDIMVPVLSGFELGRRFRAMSPQRALWMVAVSARNLPQDVAYARECGFDDYLPKPFRMGVLEERLRGLLRNAA